ncbi:MAG: IS1595 family transposase [Planctomycetota bacterium]
MNTDELPKTLLQAVTHFADEGRAHDFLVAMRWPGGVRCAHCNSENIGKLSVSVVKGKTDKDGKPKPDKVRRVWNCKECKQQFTAKIGTIFAESALPLSKWLPALWLVVNAKNGVSSCELGRALGVTQKTAWFMGHRIRTSIQRGGGIVRMDGVVEVDESFIGGLARNMHADKRAQKIKGTGGKGKTAVMGLLQRHSEKNPVSRVVTNVIPNTRHEVLSGEIRKYVLKGAELQTDAHAGYLGMDDYTHKVVDHAECYVKDGVHTNGLENYWCLLKRTIKGTYVHCAPFHLFRYLDEQTYRFNERKGDDRARFVDAVQTTKNRRLTWKKLTGKSDQKR